MARTAKRSSGPPVDAYQSVTAQIVEMLEAGVAPWRMTWDADAGFPRSIAPGNREYTGINVFTLQVARMMNGWTSPYFGTFDTIRKAGGMVRKGEKSRAGIVVYKPYIKEVTDEKTGQTEERSAGSLRWYKLFSAEQADGLNLPAVERRAIDHDPIAACEALVTDFVARGPSLRTGGTAAYYDAIADAITVPSMSAFETAPEFYAAVFHESGHASGHSSRLDREGFMDGHKFGSVQYGKEELVAEMTAAFLCAATGISPATIENSAAYLGSWLKTIKGDPKLIVQAASQAQRASDHVQGIVWGDAPTPTKEAAPVAGVGPASPSVAAPASGHGLNGEGLS